MENEPPIELPAEIERSEEHTSELQSQSNLVCRLLLEKKKKLVHPGQRLHNPVSDYIPSLIDNTYDQIKHSNQHQRGENRDPLQQEYNRTLDDCVISK